jgi:hypothetical protein
MPILSIPLRAPPAWARSKGFRRSRIHFQRRRSGGSAAKIVLADCLMKRRRVERPNLSHLRPIQLLGSAATGAMPIRLAAATCKIPYHQGFIADKIIGGQRYLAHRGSPRHVTDHLRLGSRELHESILEQDKPTQHRRRGSPSSMTPRAQAPPTKKGLPLGYADLWPPILAGCPFWPPSACAATREHAIRETQNFTTRSASRPHPSRGEV